MVRAIGMVMALSLVTFSVVAKDYGIKGPVYPIIEDNLLQLIYQRLNTMQQDGTLESIQKDIQERARQKIQRPTAVKGITHATHNRAWLFDPTWALGQSIFDHNGQLIAQAGQRVNPFDWLGLPETLLFINADNSTEIEYTEQLLREEQNPVKIILVNGNVADLVEQLSRPVYFDQQGLLTSHFGILHTPAIVKQQGRVLAIEEVAL